MKKIVIPVAVLLGLLLLGSTSLAEDPERWYTEFTSDVFTFPSEGSCTFTLTDEEGETLAIDVEVVEDAPLYRKTVLLRPGPGEFASIVHIHMLYGMHCAKEYGESFQINPDQPVRFHISTVVPAESYLDAKDQFDGMIRTVTSDCEPEGVDPGTFVLERYGTRPFYDTIDTTWVYCIWTRKN